MKTAKKPARASRHVPAVHVLFNLLSRRWALHILWELREKPTGFRALRTAVAMSPTMLSRRLEELKTNELVAEDAAGYALTARGQALSETLGRMNGLADEWFGA